MFGQEISHSSAMNIIESIASYTNQAFNITGGGGGGLIDRLKSETKKIIGPGYIEFKGWPQEFLKIFAIIPEDGRNTFPPENNKKYKADGLYFDFWTDERYWLKVADGRSIVIHYESGMENLTYWHYLSPILSHFLMPVKFLPNNTDTNHHIPNPFPKR